MSDTVQVAIISAAGSVATAITALILAYRLFDSLERRIAVIEADLKQFFQMLAGHDRRLAVLEEKNK